MRRQIFDKDGERKILAFILKRSSFRNCDHACRAPWAIVVRARVSVDTTIRTLRWPMVVFFKNEGAFVGLILFQVSPAAPALLRRRLRVKYVTELQAMNIFLQ